MEIRLLQTNAVRRHSVSRNLVQAFGVNISLKILCQKNIFKAKHVQSTCREMFSSCFIPKKKNHYWAAVRCKSLYSIEKENLHFYRAKKPSQCRSLGKTISWLCPPKQATDKVLLIVDVSLTKQEWASVLFISFCRLNSYWRNIQGICWSEGNNAPDTINPKLLKETVRGGDGIMV